MAQKRRMPDVFERRTLTISVAPVVELVNGDDCGSLTCGYCSGGCTNCTASCRGAASTKHLQIVDPIDEVALDKQALIEELTRQIEAVDEQRG